jgi:hypothetical protein
MDGRLAAMEISFKLTEDEFVRGARLERKASSRSSLKTALFWMSIMAGLMLLYAYLRPSDSRATESASASTIRTASQSLSTPVSQPGTLFQQVGPFLVIAGIWILIVMGLVPLRLRYLYRKDPRMQGQFTVEMTSDFISTDNTAGTFSKSAWNVYDGWCEGKGIVVLMSHSGAYSVMSLAGLTQGQQNEVRSILSASIPRK